MAFILCDLDSIWLGTQKMNSTFNKVDEAAISGGDITRGQQGNASNVYSGFDIQLLADALNVEQETAKRIQGENNDGKNIIKVQGLLQLVSPHRRSRQ